LRGVGGLSAYLLRDALAGIFFRLATLRRTIDLEARPLLRYDQSRDFKAFLPVASFNNWQGGLMSSACQPAALPEPSHESANASSPTAGVGFNDPQFVARLERVLKEEGVSFGTRQKAVFTPHLVAVLWLFPSGSGRTGPTG
jgi:hypothetical protein